MSDIEILCSHCKRTFEMPRWVIKQMYDAIMTQTPIPKEEIELFKQLPDLQVIFDVGARTDTDYYDTLPNAEHHLFEPNPVFIEDLVAKLGDKSNVYINAFGLGDRNEERGYHDGLQSFVGSWILGDKDHQDRAFSLQTLGYYVKEKNIQRIDFLKIDTEGFELKILLGATSQFNIIRFIQYEHFGLTNHKVIKGLLEDDFWIEHVGYRNVLCINRNLIDETEYKRLKYYIEVNKLSELV